MHHTDQPYSRRSPWARHDANLLVSALFDKSLSCRRIEPRPSAGHLPQQVGWLRPQSKAVRLANRMSNTSPTRKRGKNAAHSSLARRASVEAVREGATSGRGFVGSFDGGPPTTFDAHAPFAPPRETKSPRVCARGLNATD